jgi:hypothetical protein
MNANTADKLIQALYTNYVITVTNNQKLMAFEIALEKFSPEVHEEYRRQLERIEESSHGIPEGGFQALRTALLQE